MTHRLASILAVFLMLSLNLAAFAADGDQPPAGNQPPPPPRMGPGGPGGAGGPGGMFGRDALSDAIALLGDLNLSPAFTLTADQKTKLQAIRDDFKKEQDKWAKDHEADIKDIEQQMADLRESGGNREDIQKIMQARQKLQETAPKGDEFVKQIKALLTEEQLKLVTAKQAELTQQRKDMQRRFGPGGPGGGPGGGGPGGGPRGGPRGGDQGGGAQ